MAFGNFYAVGLASTDVTSPVDPRKIFGNGTLWGTGAGNARPGDTFEHGGVRVTIYDVIGDEELDLLYDWPGSAFTNEAYVIRQESPLRHTASELAGRTNDLLSALYIRRNQAAIFAVEEFGIDAPPTDYDVGQQLVVGSSPTGTFTGHDDEIAEKTENGWAFYAPSHGWITVTQDTNVARTFNAVLGSWGTTGSLLGAPVWSGAWSAATNYVAGNLVTRLNKVYASNTSNLNKAPESNPTDWTLFLTIGEHGGALTLAYTFRTATTSTTANTAGRVNLDAAPGSATKLYINPVDTFGNDWTTTLASLASGTSARLGRVRLIVPGDQTRQWTAVVTAVVLSGSHYELTLASPELGSTTFADSSAVLFMWTDVGDEGTQGVAGDTGPRGFLGGPVALPFVFSTLTADADPGNGNLRLDMATQESATVIRVDMLTSAGINVGALLDSITAIGTGTIKAIGSLVHADTPETKWLIFSITAQATPTGYRNLSISIIDSSAANPFADADAVVLSWIPIEKGDQGETGATGPQGAAFSPDHTVATIDLRDAYDGQTEGTSVLVEEDSTNGNRPTLYFLVTPGVGSPPVGAVWSQGFDFAPGSDAINIAYDNAASGAASDNVQAALDELFGIATADQIAEEDVASAATADIGATTSKFVRITGTTTITSFGTAANKLRFVRFNAALTLTYNATTLKLLGAANRVTATDDWGIYRSDGSGNWYEIYYHFAASPVISSVLALASAIAITANVVANVTSIVLTPGDWDVSGFVFLVPAASTSMTNRGAAISLTTAAFPTAASIAETAFFLSSAAVVPATTQKLPLSTCRINITVPTTVYLAAFASFTISTLSAYGAIWARRCR